MRQRDDDLMGIGWDAIRSAQAGNGIPRQSVRIVAGRDYGYDHAGEGMVRMVPSGRVIPLADAIKELAR